MEGFRFATEQKVAWRDLDALGHVNNAVYATYFENGRLEYLSQLTDGQTDQPSLILAELTITFKSPAFLRETLLIGVYVYHWSSPSSDALMLSASWIRRVCAE